VPIADISDPRFASDEAASEERLLDDLAEIVHSGAHYGLTRCKLDLADRSMQARSGCPAVFELPDGKAG
jgi:hypothetical protein